ncbi:hypothetical protein H2198_005970 [Neophaeococcomyces mojaviensis]|uniref:Uncharacterized protein n=1 Tax=Neophaeococcomyces mojaviensis TaxID=3383035 RepID=A0ACC3A4F2_9EURO|nr:hypothetical protein H2198_005970 [Knufia sp. JES_112]
MSVSSGVGTVQSPDGHRKLTQWVVNNNGFFHSDLEIVHHASKGYYAIVRDGKELKAQTRVASCPVAVALSVLNVLNVEPFSNHGTKFPDRFLRRYQEAPDVLQTFFLMEQYLLGEKSWWSPYIQTLPTIEDVDNLQYEAEADAAWVRGTNLEVAFASQRQKWHHQLEEANVLLQGLEWENAKSGKYSQELYRWASTIFGSRSFTSQVLHGTTPADLASRIGRYHPNHSMLKKLFEDRFAVLLPLMDVLNHKPAARVEWQGEHDLVALQILEDYTSGQEVFNNYGPRDNEGLLMSYGFVLEDNVFEHVLISINAHPGTPLEATRSWPKDERSNDSFNCYIFDVNHPIVEEAKYLERALFSYDLLDSISVMCANDRELQAMNDKQKTWMSSSLPNLFDDCRNYHETLAQIMRDSRARASRMEAADPARSHLDMRPQTQKQKNAQIYREKQISILRAAAGVCAFALLHACTDQTTSDLLLSMQMKLPELYSPNVESICTRLTCATRKNELFTAESLIELLPSPTANGVRLCLKNMNDAMQSAFSSPDAQPHEARVKTSMSITLSALCVSYRSGTQLSSRLSTWIQELISSYPPEDSNWNYVPPPGPYSPDEEPPAALTAMLEAQSNVIEAVGSDSAARNWLEPKMICWGWNVMEEETIRVPIEIERFVSEAPEQVEGQTGFLMYCKQG